MGKQKGKCIPPATVGSDFVRGNVPSIGYSLKSKEQKADILSIYVDEKGKSYKTAGKIDYVAGGTGRRILETA